MDLTWQVHVYLHMFGIVPLCVWYMRVSVRAALESVCSHAHLAVSVPLPVEPGAAHASAMLAREGAGLVVAVARMRRNDRGCWARPDQGTVQGTAAEHGV